MDIPTVSVLVPAYNAETCLRAALDSILGQTFADLELIVVDDGSTDSTPEILASYDDPRLRVVRQENGGSSAARNRALDEARGEFVAWQDADDISTPNRLELMVAAARAHHADLVHCDMLLIDSDDQPLAYWASRWFAPDEVLPQTVACGTPFNNPAMVLRRSLYEGKRFLHHLKLDHDTELSTRVAQGVLSVHVAAPLYLYRKHSGTLTASVNYKGEDICEILNSHDPRELVPDAVHPELSAQEQSAVALAALAVRLHGRGSAALAQQCLEASTALLPGCRQHVALLCLGLAELSAGHSAEAVTVLSEVRGEPRALTENFLGEALAHGGRRGEAMPHLLEALRLSPRYPDAMDNLRALANGMNLVDATWRRFAA